MPIAARRPKARTAASSRRARGKSLRNKGIREGDPPSAPSSERSVGDLRDVPRTREPLRYDREEEGRREGREKRVGFEEDVTVAAIPASGEYPERVRRKLWSDTVEICRGVERNLAEFAAENHDWRRAFEEDEMYVCGITGDLIHPAHVGKRYVFGSLGNSPPSLSDERRRYWDHDDVV